MKELDFSKKTGITVKMPDGEFLVRKPTLAEIKKLQKDQKKSKDDWAPVTDMLTALGLPEEQLLKLDSDQIGQLTDSLMPEKKRA